MSYFRSACFLPLPEPTAKDDVVVFNYMVVRQCPYSLGNGTDFFFDTVSCNLI